MERREFIKNSCSVCLSGFVVAGMLSSCRGTRYISGALGKDGLTIDTTEFIVKRKDKKVFRSFVIVRNEVLQYPICVYRLGENEYKALWMQCTHQGAELQASDDQLHCPAHGSEFTSSGKVSNGPADKNLRSFPVSISDNRIFIDLRAV